MEIKPSEHVLICGATGSGKTVLAKAYTANNFKNVCVLDTKGTFDFKPFLTDKQYILYDSIDKVYNETNINKIIYRPNIYENNKDYYERFFEFCYKRTNTICLVDEAMSVCDAHSIPFWYKAILTRGRELNVSCWSCTQRPIAVSNFILTESIHWFIFRLNNYDDRIKLFKSSGEEKFKNSLHGHYFYYFNNNSGGITKSILNFGGKQI